MEEKCGYPLSKHTRQGYKQLKTKQICYAILMYMYICGYNRGHTAALSKCDML